MRENIYKRQEGMTFLGVLIVVALVLSFALLAMKLVPIYLRNHTIKSVMEGMNDLPDVTKMTSGLIKGRILDRLDINSVYHFDKKTLSVKKVGGYFELNNKYEVREHLVGNIDIVLSFNNQTKIPIR